MLKRYSLSPASGGKAKKLVVLFHGYGSSGQDLLKVAQRWSPLLPETEFLVPNGPEACESHPAGFQWFGLGDFTPPIMRARLDKVGPFIKSYLQKCVEERGLNLSDLAIGGFSQGGMLALEMIFAAPGIRGAICYSGGLYPPDGSVKPSPHTKVLLIHGDEDMAVPYSYFKDACYHLEKLGVTPQTLTCKGLGHSIDMEGVTCGGKFLRNIFTKKP